MAHDPKLVAEARALRAGGSSLGEIASKLGVKKATVQPWVKDVKPGQPPPSPVVENHTENHTIHTAPQVQIPAQQPSVSHTTHTGFIRKKTRAELVDELIDEKLQTLIEQERHFRDKDWLERQSAYDLAYLNGTSTDKLIRMHQSAEQGVPPPRKEQAELPLNGTEGDS